MAKVTKKLQITLPKGLSTALGIGPGTELAVEAAGEVMRLRPVDSLTPSNPSDTQSKVEAFDEATERQRQRDARLRAEQPDLFENPTRGWKREDLYDRGLPR